MVKLQDTIATWSTVDLDGDVKWIRLEEIETLCKLVADLKLQEARDSLESVQSVGVPLRSISVTGALAGLGNEEALKELHQLTNEGELHDCALAIEMCRYLADQKSAAIVKDAAEGEQRQLRYAATKDLLRFEDRHSLP